MVELPTTITNAVAAPGGCKQEVMYITEIAKPTASAEAKTISGVILATVIPTIAEIKCPPTNDQGCDKGPNGTANNNTADAPIDATIQGISCCGRKYWLIKAVIAIPKKPANPEISFSVNEVVFAGGRKSCNRDFIKKLSGEI